MTYIPFAFGLVSQVLFCGCSEKEFHMQLLKCEAIANKNLVWDSYAAPQVEVMCLSVPEISMVDGYSISDDKNKLDIQVIHHFLSHSYWAKNIPVETVQRSIDNSFCVGIYDTSGAQVAFARVITDFATFAYLGDVFVVEHHRNKGLSKWLVKFIVEHPLLQGLRRLLLVTADAHGLYQQFGFQPITQSENYLSIHNPNIYLNI